MEITSDEYGQVNSLERYAVTPDGDANLTDHLTTIVDEYYMLSDEESPTIDYVDKIIQRPIATEEEHMEKFLEMTRVNEERYIS